MPQSNQSELPAMSVTILAIQPPVQLSAVTSGCLLARKRAPTVSASACSCESVGASIGTSPSGTLGGRFEPMVVAHVGATGKQMSFEQHTPLMRQFFTAKAEHPD